jgi:hypothetical protein
MTRKERNTIYKIALDRFRRLNTVNASHIQYGLCSCLYHSVNNLPEILKHKPKEPYMQMFDGYWFDITNPYGFTKREQILIQAIKETE